MHVLLLALAFAQESPLVGSAWEMLPSVQADALSEIVDSNARIYGVAGYLERRTFPMLDSFDEEPGLFIGGETQQVSGIVDLPTMCLATLRDVESSPACMAITDMVSTTGAVAYGNRNLALFYSASFNGVYAPDIFISRWIMPVALAPMSYFQMLTAPVQTGPLKIGPGFHDLIGTSRTDYVVGARGGIAGVSAHVGFLGSDAGNSLFTNLSEARLRLLLSAVLRDGVGDIPYLLGGVVASPILEQAGVDGVRPSLFGRKLSLAPASVSSTEQGRLGDLWTGHLGTTTPIVDAETAIAVKPQVLVHALRLSVHDPEYPAVGEYDEVSDLGEDLHVKLSGGFVQMPALPWYGVDRQTVPYVELTGNAGNVFELVLAYNSEEIRTVFPYARNAVQLRFVWTLGLSD